MDTHQRSISDEQFGRVYEYDDRYVLAFDLHGTADEISVDTVGTTAIVVAEGADGESAESQFDLPGEAEATTVQNGVLTVEVAK